MSASSTFKRQLTNTNFMMFAEMVSNPAAPDEYSPAAMARLMEKLDPYVIQMKNVRFKYHARNQIKLIEFSTVAEKKAYLQAWDNYLKACAAIEGEGNVMNAKFLILVQFLKFRQAAELIRAPYLARELYNIVFKEGKAAVCACNFKETIAKITTILIKDYNVPREEISLIWGGVTAKKKKKLTKKEREEILKKYPPEVIEQLKRMGIDVTAEDLMDIDEEEAIKSKSKEIEELGLGAQSLKQRQEEIDRFQSDKSKFCFFTFKAGGVGLSLHQEMPHLRQRKVLLAPTYSAIEMVQGLGRSARLTSCSDTEQIIVFYNGTIEVRVAATCSLKLKCLSKAVRQKESWDSVIMDQHRNFEEDEEETEETPLLGNGDEVESEEDIDSALANDNVDEDEEEEEED